jgi:hypothetical protein
MRTPTRKPTQSAKQNSQAHDQKNQKFQALLPYTWRKSDTNSCHRAYKDETYKDETYNDIEDDWRRGETN